jgi:hypothetical protein
MMSYRYAPLDKVRERYELYARSIRVIASFKTII